MDDDAKELMKIAAATVLQPVTKVVGDAIGVLGGDRLGAFRKANRAKWETYYTEERAKIDRETETPDLRMAAEILGQAQDESRDELLKIWAKLMAALLDERKAALCRREFVEIASKLEPLDAIALEVLANNGNLAPSRRDHVMQKAGATSDEVLLAFRNLEKLGLTSGMVGLGPGKPFLMPLGRQLLTVIS